MSSPAERSAAIARGLERQLEWRARLIASGRVSLGWKAGFGAPASLKRFGLQGPLVGFMTDASRLAEGNEVDVSGWARAVAEPELAVYLGEKLVPGRGGAETRAAISSIGPAIELADIDGPPEDLESTVSGNIFHKAVILGERDSTRNGGDVTGLEAVITHDGVLSAVTDRLEDLTGRLVDVLSHLAILLADHGETMRAGEVVICGSIVPPIEVAPGSSVSFELRPLPPISVQFAP